MVLRTGTLFFAAAIALFAQTGASPNGLIHVNVDARDAPRRLIHVQMKIPAAPGPLTLLYPQWIPGEHSPSGPITDLVNLRIGAGNQPLAWKRDSLNLYAFHLTVPANASPLDVAFDFISPSETSGIFSEGASITTQLAVLNWNQLLLYPQGPPASQIQYRAALRLPPGWRYGTALPVDKETGDQIDFRPVPLTTLIDSPVSAGAHYRTVEFGIFDGVPHFMHIASDSGRALAITPEVTRQYQKLIAEAGALFGSRHYRGYHFLLTLSDHVASFGLEHHESSDDRLEERAIIDGRLRAYHAELLPHEFVHSWNGKFRRPAGLVTHDYSQPMKGDLLWIYEGLTEYLGAVLAARSGLEAPEMFRDRLAYVAAHLEHESGRAWRSLEDTAVSAQILYAAPPGYSSLRRGVDFYDEAQLVWLEADTLIRQLSKGAKSLDDFCRIFFAGPPDPVVKPYTLEDVIAALNAVQPHDWSSFFRERVEMVNARPLGPVFESAGWKLAYRDKASEYWTAAEQQEKTSDFTLSLGMVVRNEGGTVEDVEIGGPAQKAGLAPGARITSVNGRQFTPALLREAVQSARADQPIEIVVKNGEYFSTHRLSYGGGEKFPYLERDSAKPDALGAIVRARTN
jgi:predicted metalloprotease with PDZ domain